MGTIKLRCFSCVVYAESSGVLQLFRPKDVCRSKYFCIFPQSTQLPELCCQKQCILPCLMFATQSSLLSDNPRNFPMFSSSREPWADHCALVRATLQEHECKTCQCESIMNAFHQNKKMEWTCISYGLWHNFKWFCINHRGKHQTWSPVCAPTENE